MNIPKALTKYKALAIGVIVGILFICIFAILAIIIFFGAKYIEAGHLTVENMFKCLFSLIFGALGMVTASVILPDLGKAAVSLDKIFEVIDMTSEIDVKSKKGVIP